VSDHDVIEIEILGLKTLKRLFGHEYQKQTFDMKAMEGRQTQYDLVLKQWAIAETVEPMKKLTKW